MWPFWLCFNKWSDLFHFDIKTSSSSALLRERMMVMMHGGAGEGGRPAAAPQHNLTPTTRAIINVSNPFTKTVAGAGPKCDIWMKFILQTFVSVQLEMKRPQTNPIMTWNNPVIPLDYSHRTLIKSQMRFFILFSNLCIWSLKPKQTWFRVWSWNLNLVQVLSSVPTVENTVIFMSFILNVSVIKITEDSSGNDFEIMVSSHWAQGTQDPEHRNTPGVTREPS